MNKRFLLVLLLVTLSALAFAGATAEESPDADEIELRFTWWTNEVRTAVTLEMIDAYEAMNDGLTITPEYTGWAGYWDKLATQIAANDVPDVLQMVEGRLTEFGPEGGVIAALNDYPMDFDKVDAAALASWSLGGTVYGMPAGLNGWAVLYNPAVFDEAGVEYPTPDWTWADYEAIATSIHENTGKYGVSFTVMYQDLIFLVRGAGYEPYTEDGKAFGYDDYSFITDYLAMNLRMHQSGALIEHTFTEENFNNWAANPMAFGEAGMVFIPSNQAAPINEGVGEALPFMTIPGTSERNTSVLSAALGFTMSSSTQYPDITAEFVNWLGTSNEALEIGQANRGVPATAEARAYMVDRGIDPALATAFGFVDIAAPTASPLKQYPVTVGGELQDLQDEIFAKVMFEVLTPEEAAAEFHQRGNEILGRQ